MPEDKGDRLFIVLKIEMLTEQRGKGIRYFKNQVFEMYLFFFLIDLLSIQHIPFNQYNNFKHFH